MLVIRRSRGYSKNNYWGTCLELKVVILLLLTYNNTKLHSDDEKTKMKYSLSKKIKQVKS